MASSLYATPFPDDFPPTGGDSLTVNLNQYYESGDIAWMLTSTALVLLMIPGVGFFYSGLARRKSALSLIWLSLISIGVVGFQWFFWGYSLSFGNGSSFIGNMQAIGFRNVLGAPSPGSTKLPEILFAIYQGMFAAITAALAIGAAADRGRMLPCVVFIFVWTTIIYDPIACWTWNANGWSFKMGGLDFAGGTPVHIASGAAALAYSLMLGKRAGYSATNGLPYRPHNVTHVVLGTVFLWVGWFGFNGGSALAANIRAVMACFVTHTAAATGGVTWVLLDYRLDGKWSTVGFCSGVISGLVAITPAAGYVPAWSAIIFGVVGAIVCNFATKIKYLIHVDDALDIFAVHGVGGIAGNLMTALFAADYIAALDGATVIPGGWLNHHYIQLAYQLADSVAGFSYSFGGTCLILFLMNLVPGLSLRATEDEEVNGMDDAQLGEFAYDYVELRRETSDVIPGDIEASAGSSKGSVAETVEPTLAAEKA
jgi:Amt family ammonium transporter